MSLVDAFKNDIDWAKPVGSGCAEDERAIMRAAMCRRMLGIMEAVETLAMRAGTPGGRVPLSMNEIRAAKRRMDRIEEAMLEENMDALDAALVETP